MECEKFEPLLLDELYDELDELTSAAVKRHVSGCSRCASILNGMRGTRQLVSLPVLEPPPDFAERIIAAARETQKVTSFRSQGMRALSWAGSWAMRPQTAMAAVFLLMVGFSAVLLRANQRQSARSAEVSVTVVGEPVAPPSPEVAAAPALPPVPAPAGRASLANADTSGGGDARDRAIAAPTAAQDAMEVPQQRRGQRDKGQDPFSSAMAAYRAGNFGAATRQFDLVAANAGDANAESAAIWAARSVRDGRGCAAALGRYDAVAQKAGGSQTGNDALFESANCQIKLGQIDAARDKLNRLLGAPEYEVRARQALGDLNVIAARKVATSRGAAPALEGAAASPPAAARATKPAAAARPAAPAEVPAGKSTPK